MPRVSFTIIWKLENFTFLPKTSQHEQVTSPLFVADNMEKTSWNLLLRTPAYSQTGYSNDDEFRFYLSKSSQTEPNLISVDYELSILSRRGLKEKSVSVNKFRFHMGNSLGTPLCIPRDEIFDKREILPGDTLTVQCLKGNFLVFKS
ncbi:hypothetical protein HNY73_018327 [Argiope bruennichi]|uniref:MATH domain-containing protein n=1 Tax=Argiope bruennichi TaxID=94029 RepID=A0A8T0EDX3_ARGBR|nr:hypothetical protein HNY73_018327 [Argiope bruennichi]